MRHTKALRRWLSRLDVDPVLCAAAMIAALFVWGLVVMLSAE